MVGRWKFLLGWPIFKGYVSSSGSVQPQQPAWNVHVVCLLSRPTLGWPGWSSKGKSRRKQLQRGEDAERVVFFCFVWTSTRRLGNNNMQNVQHTEDIENTFRYIHNIHLYHLRSSGWCFFFFRCKLQGRLQSFSAKGGYFKHILKRGELMKRLRMIC